MSSYPVVRLKRDRAQTVRFRHPWVFSGAVSSVEGEPANGEVVNVVDAEGRIVGTGTYSTHSMISVRIFEFGEASLDADWLRSRLRRCSDFRCALGYAREHGVTGYRLVFGESDGLPGLVVDRYDNIFVMQSATAGVDRMLPMIAEVLTSEFGADAVYERSDLPARSEEGLEQREGLITGSLPDKVVFEEWELKFVAYPTTGQKTGFYLDQKELRRRIQAYSAERSVLNLFANTGSFSVAALVGGAKSVHNVESSSEATQLVGSQLELNGIDPERVTVEEADVFDWLPETKAKDFDMVILDPPALIKSRNDRGSGRRAYHFLNREALRLLRPGGILVTSSCSAFFPEEDFAFELRRASVHIGCHLQPIGFVRQSPDHPVSIYFLESYYLKTFLFRVS